MDVFFYQMKGQQVQPARSGRVFKHWAPHTYFCFFAYFPAFFLVSIIITIICENSDISNKTEKMKNGIPLSDQDRIPWLESLRDILNENLLKGKTVILGCSALQKPYRDILRSADPYYPAGTYDTCVVKFVLLDVRVEVVLDRVKKRAMEGKHFMPVELLQSQIDLLRVDGSEGIFKVDASIKPEDVVGRIKDFLTQNGFEIS